MNRFVSLVAAAVVVACSGRKEPAPVDSAPPPAAPDTASALALRDSATSTVASLLDRPDAAVFDSVIVVQPPRVGERLPAMAVCGRISGPTTTKLRRSPARFVYQSKWALYVEDDTNGEQFAKVWGDLCTMAGGVVVAR